MNNIAALDSGTAFHIVSLNHKPFNKYFKKVIYIKDFTFEQLKGIDILIVTCSSSIEQILKHQDILENQLNIEEACSLLVVADLLLIPYYDWTWRRAPLALIPALRCSQISSRLVCLSYESSDSSQSNLPDR